MAKVVDYYLALVSPFAYLGSQELERIARAQGATLRVKPVNLGEIFPKTGGLPLAKRAPERQAYRLVELARWAKFRGLPLNLKPKHFPAPEQAAACTVLAAAETGGDPVKLAHAYLRAVWAEERDIADAETIKAILGETGHDAAKILAKAEQPATREAHAALTEEALKAGVFGSPSYLYKGELFWGQDRLDFLERALAAG